MTQTLDETWPHSLSLEFDLRTVRETSVQILARGFGGLCDSRFLCTRVQTRTMQTDGPEMSPRSAAHLLCDSGEFLNLSEPVFTSIKRSEW